MSGKKGMKGPVKDLAGQRFGNLVAVELIRTERLGALWKCRCNCGNETTAWAYRLKEGRKKSCGCLWISTGEYAGKLDRLTTIWKAMKKRCNNTQDKDYRFYGARGVTVCENWTHLKNFQAWAYASGYESELTIDRIDSSGPYSPDNCRWITQKENCRKQRPHSRYSQRITTTENGKEDVACPSATK